MPSYKPGHKRKAQLGDSGATLQGSRLSSKKIRRAEHGEDEDVTDEDSDTEDIEDTDEYIPGTARPLKSNASVIAAPREKKAVKAPRDSSSATQASKMSFDNQETSIPGTPLSNPLATLKGPHGRPLSREQIRKANHSMIERRRREKMNKAFADLREMCPNLSKDGEGIKGEFKLEVLEKTVEHMRYLTQRLVQFESKKTVDGGSGAPWRRHYDDDLSETSHTSSDPYPGVYGPEQGSFTSGIKRKVGGCATDFEDLQDSQRSRRSYMQSPSMDVGSQANASSSSSRSMERDRTQEFITPHLPVSRLSGGPTPSGINSLVSSPADSSTRSFGFGIRDATRSPFARADSQATVPEDIPAHDTVHPSLQSHPSELVRTMSMNTPHAQLEALPSAFGGLPSAFFRSAYRRADQTSLATERTSRIPFQEAHPSTIARYRNPDLTLPPPVNMNSPTSPFFRPNYGPDKIDPVNGCVTSGRSNSSGRSTPAGASPFLPPIMGAPALFDGVLPQVRERHLSRTSVSSLASDLNLLGKDEEAAANVLLALSSPDVMTPWQPTSSGTQSLASLERWSLDQGATTVQPSENNARSRSRSEASSSNNETTSRRDSQQCLGTALHTSASRSCSASEQTLPVGSTSGTAASTSRMRKTAMDFLDLNRDLQRPVFSIRS